MPTAYSYLRFSTPEQAKGDSSRRQTDLAERYAAKHGLTLDTSLRMTDEGVSAFRAKNIKTGALGRFLRLVEDGFVEEGSFLLVENLDRVSRARPWDALLVFQNIINAGVIIVTLQDERVWSEEDLRENPFRIFESLFAMIRANQESETKSRRLKAVWEHKRRTAGTKAMTSRAPGWLRLEGQPARFVVNEDRAAVVRRIFEMTAAGIGQHRIAETLNTEGVPCFGKAAHWHRSYIKKLLENPAVIGTLIPHELVYEGSQRLRKPHAAVPGYYPAIVDEALFQGVQAQKLDKRAPPVRQGVVANLFGGLARCPQCSGSMTRVSKGSKKGGKPYLVCSRAKAGAGCQYRAVKLDQVEHALFRDIGWVTATAPSGDDTIDQRLQQIETATSVLGDQIGALVAELADTRSPAIRARLAELEEALAEMKEEEQSLWERHGSTTGPALLQRQAALCEALEADEVDYQQANALMRQVFSKVVVNYRSGRLELEWQQGGSSEVMFAWPEDEDEAATEA